MTWVYLDDQFPDHPKVVRAGEAAAYLFVCGLAYCKRHGTDGLIPKAAALRLVTKQPKVLAGRLIDAGLWDDAGDNYAVHNYSEWNRSSASRSEAGRKAARARWDRNANASDPQCERIESADASTCTIPIPSPSHENSSSNGSSNAPPSEDDEKIEAVLAAYARELASRSQAAISNPAAWERKVVAQVRSDRGDELRQWVATYDMPVNRFVAGLIDGPRGDWPQRSFA